MSCRCTLLPCRTLHRGIRRSGSGASWSAVSERYNACGSASLMYIQHGAPAVVVHSSSDCRGRIDLPSMRPHRRCSTICAHIHRSDRTVRLLQIGQAVAADRCLASSTGGRRWMEAQNVNRRTRCEIERGNEEHTHNSVTLSQYASSTRTTNRADLLRHSRCIPVGQEWWNGDKKWMRLCYERAT